MNKLQIISLIMMCLVINISIAHAQSLTVSRFSGEAQVENFVTAPDEFQAEVQVQIPGDSDITPDQLRIKIGDLAGCVWPAVWVKGVWVYVCEWSVCGVLCVYGVVYV